MTTTTTSDLFATPATEITSDFTAPQPQPQPQMHPQMYAQMHPQMYAQMYAQPQIQPQPQANTATVVELTKRHTAELKKLAQRLIDNGFSMKCETSKNNMYELAYDKKSGGFIFRLPTCTVVLKEFGVFGKLCAEMHKIEEVTMNVDSGVTLS